MTNDDHTVKMREKILSAAERVFEVGGYTQTTIDAVAAEAGIAKGSVYNYFRSKRDLFIGVFVRAMDAQRQESEKLLHDRLSASQKLFGILDQWFAGMPYHRRLGGLFLEFWATAARDEQDGQVAATVNRIYNTWRQVLMPIIVEGVEAGEFKGQFDPEMAATLIMSIADGITVHAILDPALNIDEKLLAAVKRAITAGLNATESAE